MDTVTIRVNKALANVTTAELARRAGVSRQVVWRWENGLPKVSPETAEKLTRALLERDRMPAVTAK